MTTTAHSARSRILLNASVGAMALAASPALATQTCPTSGPCNLTVTENGQALGVTSAGGTIVNTATGTSIYAVVPVFGNQDGLVIDNRAGASINSLLLDIAGVPQPPTQVGQLVRNNGVLIVNSGAIQGDILLPIAINTFVNDGGSLSGQLIAPTASVNIYVERNAAHPVTLVGGNLINVYVDSIASSGTVPLPATLPTGFNVHGLELRGTGTTATVVDSGTGANAPGLAIFGTGSVVNKATIDHQTDLGMISDLANGQRTINYGGVIGQSLVATVYQQLNPVFGNQAVSLNVADGLDSFRNEGTINGDIGLVTANFENTGTINFSLLQTGSVIAGVADRDFSFTNSGTIALEAGSGIDARALDAALTLATNPLTTAAGQVAISNSATGSIDGGLHFTGLAKDFVFDNQGTIGIGINNRMYNAVELEVGPSNISYLFQGIEDMPADTVSITNGGTIDGGIQGEFSTRALTFDNSGAINRDAGNSYASAVHLEVPGSGPDGTIDAGTVDLTNSGAISGSTELVAAASTITVTNSGQMVRDRLDVVPTFFPTDFNGLQINQETTLDANLSVVNTGLISSDDYAAGALSMLVRAGDSLSNVPGANSATAHASLTNSGSIITRGGAFVTAGSFLGLPAGGNLLHLSFAVGAGLDAQGSSSFELHNQSGGIIRSEPGPVVFSSPFGSQVTSITAAPLAVVATADQVTIVNDGEISGGPGSDFRNTVNPNVFAVGDTWLDANALEGVIGGAIDTLFSQDNVTNSATGVINGGVALRQGDDTFVNSGTVNGNVYMGSGADLAYNDGLIHGNVDMGEGDDVFGISLASVAPGGAKGVTGTVDGGAGTDTLVFDITDGGSLNDMALLNRTGFEVEAIGGTGTVTANNLVVSAPIGMASGFVTLATGSTVSAATPGATVFEGLDGISQDLVNLGTIHGSISLGDETDSVTNYGTIDGNIDLGSGDDFFTQGINASLTGTADGGAGYDTFTFDITGGGTIHSAFYNQLANFEVLGLTGTGNVSFDGPVQMDTIGLTANQPTTFAAGSTVETQTEVAVTGSTGDDQLTNDGTINGDVNLGNGNDQFANNGTMNGDLGTGTGDDMVDNTGTITGDVNLDGDGTVNGSGGGAGSGGGQTQFAALRLAALAPTGGDDVLANSGAIGGSVFAGAGNDLFTNTGSVGGNVDMGTGTDTFVLAGSVGGNVDMGDDNDTLELRDGWSIGGTADGGAGTDSLVFNTSSTYASPNEVDLGKFTGFENLGVQGGVTALSGTGTFDAIAVDAGRLIGRTGSVINANVSVGSAGTFGSAGTVNGNVTVAGTLSPGSSPGTMTVNGNVDLGATSTSVFEFTPAVSDALVVNGALTIHSGAALTLTGTRPAMPGIYNLITASEGIDGSFGTHVTRDNTVVGVLRYTDTTLELISTFQLRAGANGQVSLTNAYLNNLLIGGTVTAGVLDAFTAIVGADGYANPAVLATLNPEAYASAAQIGFENGLAIASALRGVQIVAPQDASGLFVFGQGYGAWRRFAPQANGVSRADVRNSGFLGGVGFGNDMVGAAVFVGRGNSSQSIPGIAARNKADGTFYGARVHVAFGGFDAGASVILDRASADTSRNPAVGVAKTDSHYDLHATTIDGWIGYGFEIGGGMKVGPEVGVTHTEVKRQGVTESGGGAFALQVAGQKYKLTTLSADLKVSGPLGASLKGWVEGGVRHRLDGDPITATAAFIGTGTSFTVNGVNRAKTVGHLGAGADLAVAKNVDLFVNGDAEIDGGNGGNSVNGGVRIRF